MKIDFEKHLDSLYACALTLMKNHHDAEDLVQDTVLLAIRKKKMFDGRYPKAWMCKLMYNLMCSQYRRKRRINIKVIDDEIIEQLFGHDEDPFRKEIDPKLRKMLKRLGEGYKTALVLRAAGLSYEEIATIIQKPIGTVMSRMS